MEEGNMMILSIGNAGGNIIDTLCREAKSTGLKASRYVYGDRDERDLHGHNAENSQSILLNYDNEVFPTEIFHGIEELVIVAGLGGKTATKFTELAAATAKDTGVQAINVVATIPFHFEGHDKISYAILAA